VLLLIFPYMHTDIPKTLHWVALQNQGKHQQQHGVAGLTASAGNTTESLPADDACLQLAEAG
jgi:hypothetical protein